MKVMVNLSGLSTENEVLHKFGEVLDFGGPDGNVPASPGKGWGLNWDALNDCFRYLAEGGIWGTSKRLNFPLEIEIVNYKEFQENEPRHFQILHEILDGHVAEYRKNDKVLKTIFS